MLAAATLTALGQLLWKIGAHGAIGLLVSGLVCYCGAATLMVLAYRYGEVSTLQPLLAAGYVLSIVLGAAVLGERITLGKLGAVVLISTGVFLIARGRPAGSEAANP